MVSGVGCRVQGVGSRVQGAGGRVDLALYPTHHTLGVSTLHRDLRRRALLRVKEPCYKQKSPAKHFAPRLATKSPATSKRALLQAKEPCEHLTARLATKVRAQLHPAALLRVGLR